MFVLQGWGASARHPAGLQLLELDAPFGALSLVRVCFSEDSRAWA
jgi:hypothetical protein